MRTKRIARLWERMSAMYGSRWEIEYGPALQRDGTLAVVAELWAEALDPLPNDRLAAGIKACIDRDNLNPPSMPEFLRLCGYRPKSARYSSEEFQPSPPRLTSPDYADSPHNRCERLAKELQTKAEAEFCPSVSHYPLEARKKAVARYWLTKIAAIPGVGYAVSEAIQSANPDLRDAA